MIEIYKDDNVVLFKRNGDFFIRYDAGSHQISIREDNITEDEANKILEDPKSIDKILFDLQFKLKSSGVDPYKSNIL
jgi:hypothetical protein